MIGRIHTLELVIRESIPLLGDRHHSIAHQHATERGRQSLAAAAYTAITRNIISLVYEPGQRLEENHLVDQKGIGRTPIREALLRLAYLSHGNEIGLPQALKAHYTSVVEQHGQIIELVRVRDETGLEAVIKALNQIFKDRMVQYLSA